MAGFSHIFSDRQAADQTAGCHYSTAAGVDVGSGTVYSESCRNYVDMRYVKVLSLISVITA